MAMSDVAPADALLLHLDGFEGPLDLLLELARSHKLDLNLISIVALVDQYLAVIEGARRIRLEMAADWLVMAAWLTWLKSRLLLPTGSLAADEGEAAADVLAQRLRELQRIRAGAAWLDARAQLGHEVFVRGMPEDLTVTDRSRLALDMPGLLRAYLGALQRRARGNRYRPPVPALWSVQDALGRLRAMLGRLPDWATLEAFLPDTTGPLQKRGAISSTLLAGLELARGGGVKLRQDDAFGPILLRGAEGVGEDDGSDG